MQEYGWLHWNDFCDMVVVIGKRPNTRKMRLAACAFVRRVGAILEDPLLRATVEAAEDFADHRVNKEHLKAVRRSITVTVEEARRSLTFDKQKLPNWGYDPEFAQWELTHAAEQLPIVRGTRLVELLLGFQNFGPDTLRSVSRGVDGFIKPHRFRDDEANYCLLLRDIFGNPFRPVTFDPSWRTDTATLIAQGMYESRDFGAMPILADALQDTGCDSDDILNHCRADTTHVRGCWVVDLVLGKQ